VTQNRSHFNPKKMTTKEYGNKLQGKVISDLTMSLDGFIAGPNVSVNNPMGGWCTSLQLDASVKLPSLLS